MFEFVSRNVQDTYDLAFRMGQKLKGPVVVAFFGGLGMGKTTFTAGLAEGMGIDADVSSPTFALVNVYIGKEKTLYHFDMYRVTTWDDLYSTEFLDYYDNGRIIACEWSENIENALPENVIKVEIMNGNGENERIFKIEGKGEYEDFVC